jgi:hypothetical protein
MADDVTKPEHLRGIEPSTRGTGIYWFINTAGNVEKFFVPRINREQAGAIAADLARPGGARTLDAYRWVPERVESADSLIATMCQPARCSSDTDCTDNACHCTQGFCQ